MGHSPTPERALGDAIRAARTRHGLKQSDLAYKLGVDTATVSRWELGQTQPKPLNVSKIESVLGVRLEGEGASEVPSLALRSPRVEALLARIRAFGVATSGSGPLWDYLEARVDELFRHGLGGPDTAAGGRAR
jgi:transcriptional regulator with XRE-family HTH domain